MLSLKFKEFAEEVQLLAQLVEEWNARADRFDQLFGYSVYMRISVDRLQTITGLPKYLFTVLTIVGVIALIVTLFLRPLIACCVFMIISIER